MRLTFITDEYSQDLDAALLYARRADLDVVELRSLWGKQCVDLDAADRARLRRAIAGAGIPIYMLDSFVYKANWSDEALRDQGVELARRYCDLAHDLGVERLRIFSFWRDSAPSRAALVDAVARVAEVCAAARVQLFVENGTFTSLAQGSELAALLGEVGGGVKAVWDPANVKNGGWPESTRKGLLALAPFIGHVHVKNVHLTPGGKRFGLLSGGEVDWPEQISLLRDRGYSGYLSAETHFRNDREFTRADLDFPGGFGFSVDGAGPTERLVEELRSLVTSSPEHSIS